jgi:hypothetical protein
MSSKALRPSIVPPVAAREAAEQEMTRVGARWRLSGSRERVALLAGHVKSPPPGAPKSSATCSRRDVLRVERLELGSESLN